MPRSCYTPVPRRLTLRSSGQPPGYRCLPLNSNVRRRKFGHSTFVELLTGKGFGVSSARFHRQVGSKMKHLLSIAMALSYATTLAADDIEDKFASCVHKASVKPGTGYTSGDRGRSAALLLHNECRPEAALWVKHCLATSSDGRTERDCKLRAGLSAQTALLLNECKLRNATDAGIPC
jgi:hypothetical protein